MTRASPLPAVVSTAMNGVTLIGAIVHFSDVAERLTVHIAGQRCEPDPRAHPADCSGSLRVRLASTRSSSRLVMWRFGSVDGQLLVEALEGVGGLDGGVGDT